MAGLYASGDWHVKQGSEQAFVEAWQELAEWTTANVPGCTFAKLLRDESDPNHYVSFSPWSYESAVAAWREHQGFQERVGHLRELLGSFTPLTMNLVAQAGPPTPDLW